jgi:hypothetical protein
MKATVEAPTLAERLESARQAEAAPRARVVELQAALQAAEERRDWPEVTRLEAELQPAREALGFASAVAEALASQATAIERESLGREAARLRAEQRERAQEVIAQALDDERQAGEEIGGCLQQVLAAIGAAQDALRMAQAAEHKVGHAKRRVYEQRVILGEIGAVPGRFGWPTPATALIDTDPVIRALMQWRGPDRWNRPAPGAASAPAAPRGTTQRSPW